MARSKSSIAQLLIGYGSALSAVIAYNISSCSVQALKGAVPDFQMAVVRSLVQLVIFLIGAKLFRLELSIRTEDVPGILYLGAAYSAINVGSFGAVVYLPLTDVVGIENTATMITAFVHSRLLFNTDIAKSNFISITLCIVGILLTVQPSWLFKHAEHDCNMTLSTLDNVSNTIQPLNITSCLGRSGISSSAMSIGYILSVIGGIGCGVTYDICGFMLQDVKPIVQAVYGSALSVVGSTALMFYMEDPVLMINISQILLVLVHGVFSAVSTFLHLLSSKYITGPSLSVVYSFDLVTVLFFQYTIMHSVMPGNYNWTEVGGCFMIVFGASIPAIMDIIAYQAKSDELP